MAIETSLMTLTTGPVLLVTGQGHGDDAAPILLYGEGESGTYYVGGAESTESDAMPVSVGAYFPMGLMRGDDLYGFVAADPGTSIVIRVLRGRA